MCLIVLLTATSVGCRPISHVRSPDLKPAGGRARGASGDDTQQGAMVMDLDPQGSGAAADALPPNCRSVLTADFQLDQLEFVGMHSLQCACNDVCTNTLQPRVHFA